MYHKRKAINQMSDEEAYELLHDAGFSVLEIYRLIPLRRDYATSNLDQVSVDQKTGRPTDQIPQEDVSSKLDRAPVNHSPPHFVQWLARTLMTQDKKHVVSHLSM